MAKVTITFDIKEEGKYLVVSDSITWKGLCESATLYNGKKKKKVGSKIMEMNPGINTIEMEMGNVLPEELFSGTLITSCVIEEGVTEIGAKLFSDCKELVSVTLPTTLECIRYSCFKNCKKLGSVKLPLSLKKATGLLDVGRSDLPFEHTRLVWPEGMTELPAGIFRRYENPTAEVEIPEGVTVLHKEDFEYSVIKGVRFPASLKSIEPDAFCDAKIEHLEWPAGVPVTEQSVASVHGGFAELNYLPMAETPEVLVISGDYNCDTLIVPANVKELKISGYPMHLRHIWVDPANTVYDSRENCNAIIETATGVMLLACAWTTVPEGVTEIAKSAQGIVLAGVCPAMPSTLQKVSCRFDDFKEIMMTPVLLNALSQLNNFEGKLILTEGITELKSMVKTINRWGNEVMDKFFKSCKFTELVLPEGLKSVDDGCFDGCSLASDLVLPNSLKSIGNRAFALSGLGKNENGEEELLTLQLPAAVSSIGASAFAGMTGFKVVVPDSVTVIETSAFANWYPANVTLPQGLEVLNDLFVPSEDRASKHSSLVIPASVKSLGEAAGEYGYYSSFNDCDTITFLPKTAPALPKETMNHLSNGTLCYPKGADYAAWKEEFKGWKFVEI